MQEEGKKRQGSTISSRISESFSRLKEVLGFGEAEKERSFRITKGSENEELDELRKNVKGNFVVTSKYNWFTFLPVNLF